MHEIETDILVIGSGIAGLSYALKIADHVNDVTIITKKEIEDCNTMYAQGGIAAVVSKLDSFDAHKKDTIKCGDGLCHPSIVDVIVQEGPARVLEFVKLGIEFTRRHDDEYDLGLEGGHSKRRVLHAGDLTGEVIEKALINNIQNNESIQIYENHLAVNLFVENNTCRGAYVFDRNRGIIETFSARITVLATGGLGKVFLYTSNRPLTSGDGMAMAYHAGATLMNMEFIQFHPTLLFHVNEHNFLISEALRGEGAILRNKNGEAFMEKYDPQKELASRDIVARAIDAELKRTGDEYALLDITHKDSQFITSRFPGISRKCLSLGIDITHEPIPIVPAAHFACGGVKATPSGVTDIKNLLAIGEVACTGFHGANRLASNSLLEGAVMAHLAAKESIEILKKAYPVQTFPAWEVGRAVDSDEAVVISHNWNELRRAMWNYVGIVRSDKRLERAKKRISLLNEEIHEYYWDYLIGSDLIELRNIAFVSEAIIDSALNRKESRGVHFNVNHPKKQQFPEDTLIRRPLKKQRIAT